LYTGDLGNAIVEHVRDNGGDITHEDLAGYRVIRRRPLRAPYAGHLFVSNPPPSSGGVLIAYALRLLDAMGRNGGPGTAESMALLAEVMREQSRARASGFEGALFRGGLQRRLEASIDDAVARMRAGEPGAVEHATPGGTTHISVVDAERNAAALTVSTGSGSGCVVPRTGIHMNNMLGEFDLPRPPLPGRRLSSMMSPSVVLGDLGPRLIAGSAGSLRLRGAVLQAVVNVIGHGLGVRDAIERPRVHLEEPVLHCEGGADAAELDRLEGMGYELARWRRRNLFFGGVSAVEMLPDGTLAAAGDPRRGGAGLVVPA
jgi:gamma-glutamyltranspeptidase/glutathione hydrolase